MFDANLRGTKKGSEVLVRFWGSTMKFGDTTNIIDNTYECTIINRDKGGDNMVLLVHKPQFRKQKALGSFVVAEKCVGNRLVTYEGHVGDNGS